MLGRIESQTGKNTHWLRNSVFYTEFLSECLWWLLHHITLHSDTVDSDEQKVPNSSENATLDYNLALSEYRIISIALASLWCTLCILKHKPGASIPNVEGNITSESPEIYHYQSSLFDSPALMVNRWCLHC